MRKIFTDDILDLQFKNEGFVVVDLFNPEQAQQYYKIFNQLDSGVGGRFFASMWSSDKAYRLKVDDLVKKILMPHANHYLYKYTPFFSDLIVKKPSFNQKIDIHQDWAFVDETSFTSVFIWCPLQDVSKRNGCLQLIPKSHLYLSKIRGSNIQLVKNYSILRKLDKHLLSLELKAGQAVLYNPAILHASPPNRTFKNRLCIALTCIPEDAKLFHYHLNIETQKVEKLEIDYDFIMNFNNDNDFKKGLFNGNLKKPEGGKLVEYLPKPSQDDYAASLETLLNEL